MRTYTSHPEVPEVKPVRLRLQDANNGGVSLLANDVRILSIRPDGTLYRNSSYNRACPFGDDGRILFSQYDPAYHGG